MSKKRSTYIEIEDRLTRGKRNRLTSGFGLAKLSFLLLALMGGGAPLIGILA